MKISIPKTMATLALPLAMSASITAAATDGGIKIEHLGTNNTLVRVEGDGRYLMLPVQ